MLHTLTSLGLWLTFASAKGLPKGWKAQGCWAELEASEGRALHGASFVNSTTMTRESCTTFCADGGFNYAGVEYGEECYCGNFIRGDSKRTKMKQCNMPCSGQKNQKCGDRDRLNIFWNGKNATPPVINPGPPGWHSVGCYSDDEDSRTLRQPEGVPGGALNLTVAACVAACKAGGYAVAGVEYATECYCANNIAKYATLLDNDACGIVCSGNSSEYCGGEDALNVYKIGPAPISNSSTTTDTRTSTASAPISLSTKTETKSLSASSSSLLTTTVSSSTRLIPSYSVSSSSTTARSSTTQSSSTRTPSSSSPITSSSSAKTLTTSATSSSSTNSKTPATSSPITSSSTVVPPPYSMSSSSSTTFTSSTKPSVTSIKGSNTTSPFIMSPPSYTTSSNSSSARPSTSSSTQSVVSNSTSSSFLVTSSSSSSTFTSSSSSSSLLPNTTTSTSTESSTTLSSSSLANTTSYTQTKTVTMSMTSSLATVSSMPTAMTCPGSNNVTFTATNGATFVVECGIDRPGGDMGSQYANNFTECIQDCASTSGCLDVSFMNNYCYMKAYVNAPAPNSAVWGAKLLSAASGGGSSSVVSLTTSTSSSSPAYTTTTSMAAKVTTSSTSTSVSSTVSSTSPSVSGLPTGWSYKGCWVDNAHGRILVNNINNDAAMTIESCISACSSAGYTIAGIEYSTQCSCGNTVIQAGALAAQDSDCAMPCGGNSKEICGGPNRMSLYSNGTIKTLGVPVPQNDTSLPGSWQYVGCMTDGNNNNVRSLPWKLILSNNNTAETCLSQCSAFGYQYGGMEYGEECYCGDLVDLTTGGSVSAPESDCNMACPGNGSFVCGAGNRLSLYKWTGKPLYQWNYATGNAAGSYEYFVPGVVVPLITVPGKNGKITFVEKHGTSVFGNSTGAYELDPSLADDFTECWRTMTGIKTDVFCSAGLILPDVGARQINVGGWSADSLYGVRFYTPDGAPGVNSTNMWEEDVTSVGLQAPRWYPSAMMMANGSILIVGGEDGSNGVPTPSLELLPRAGPALYCEWLKESDPNNLYPYLTVLPSSGIFVAYWNQARILDPITLETRKMLPQIPGSVTEPLSGRTYPFEGTSVLLPQSAPYSDPLTILICGGSGPGIATALDNCVSIAPDAPNPTWTLERMPSKRVMSCMVALPDGTFLILNGAEQGVAGFGLANTPNLNAVLYDPAKPLGARMTIMANTTIARLYHSEAVLMDDGRVLVSGSDPQDPQFPEEMRVEVFNPPYYLNMNKATRLAFTLNNGIESYGYGDTITITITNGGVPARVTLLGAVASTHGNSMGQRTIFPEFSCSGATCTVTTPPNANVSPPGWFQMFVLDAQGVPSVARWVRIGGDPGGLGEWPEGAEFTRPGS